MDNFIRDLIEYKGIDIYEPNSCFMKESTSFKQSTIDVNLCVPPQKPDIEQVVKVVVDKEIVKYKVVKTPTGVSVEGQEVTGYKLLVMGDITVKVVYVALEEEQSMHSFHVIIPFCEYIVMPKDFRGLSIVTPEIYVEDIYVRQQDCRCLFGNVTLLTMADIC
ncbi:MAG: DUF3794 domain-containing protein [Clostridium sp.]|uniref:SPOCS domain-containing protein n=1 Tax=Clostridium sp. TaxID=1506 RepID=UPI002FC692A2